jgi:hypothetical protein
MQSVLFYSNGKIGNKASFNQPGLGVPLYLIIVLAGELCRLELERALRIVVERVVNIHGSVVPLVIVDRVVNVYGSVIVASGRKSRSRDGSWRIAWKKPRCDVNRTTVADP